MLPCSNSILKIRRRSEADTYTKDGEVVHVLATADYRCFFMFTSDAKVVGTPEGQIFNTADGTAYCDGVVIAALEDEVQIEFDDIPGSIPIDGTEAESDLQHYNLKGKIVSLSPMVGPVQVTEIKIEKCS